MTSSSREAYHAGSWYTSNGKALADQLEKWLSEVKESQKKAHVRGIIGPHAGLSYSGPTAAHAYKRVDPKLIKRIFVLGPSHHYYTSRCELTACKTYETPMGTIEIDLDTNAALMKTGKFKKMSLSVDEEEHSIELHLPYIAHIMKGYKFKLVPILVGNLSTSAEKAYGKLLSPFLDDPCNFFVISSDFCHWGSRFRYTWVDKSYGSIWKSIKALDNLGMSIIETLNTQDFTDYLKQYENTICGRHPIGVFLNALENYTGKQIPEMKFVHYSQSSKCYRSSDSSVSYAAGICRFCTKTSSETSEAKSSKTK
mmetsp:Transcript_7760/g.11733  ORF Transcript_7760/g.11733 Transcript_7760/m.11733 type:complete len:311 (-) Transcript_7760:120-1052(-)